MIDEDFTFVVPLFGNPSYFRNGRYLARYKRKTLLAINVDGDEMTQFADDAEAATVGLRTPRALSGCC